MQAIDIEPAAFIDDQLLARLNRPTLEATTLPNAAYTDPRFLDLEREKLFARTWMFAGYVEQIRSPGDVMPSTIAGMPIVLIRTEAGAVRVFHNVCRHRGATLVNAPGCKQERLVCPYHAWTYDLDGHLRARPHLGGANQHEYSNPGDDRPGLVPVRFEIWHRLIFVNLDGAAAPFAEYIAPAVRLVGERDLSDMRYGGTTCFEFKANWKLVHENFFDVWHTFKIHPKLCELSPMETKHRTEVDGACFWTHHTIVEPQEGRGKGLPFIQGLPPRKGLFFHLFPSTDINLWPDHVAVFQVEPVAPDRTLEQVHLFFSDSAMGDEYADYREKSFELWRELNAEDIAPLELMQQGRRSPGFDGGRSG